MALMLDVRVPAEGGTEVGARLLLPEGDGPHPAITIAHGFVGTEEQSLERFAQAFAAAGFVVLVHDHRNFPTNGGDIDPSQHVANWRRAISYLESRPEVDPTRIGLWGTSDVGEQALMLGATDRRLRCAMAQGPGSRVQGPTNSGNPLTEVAATVWFREHLLNPGTGRH